MEGPYTLDHLIKKGLGKESKLISGIYIWGVQHQSGPKKMIPLYVGKASHLTKRLFEHLCAWRGGAYKIPTWYSITNPPYKFNYVYEPKQIADFKNLLANVSANETVMNVIDNFFCCWEVLDEYKTCNPRKIEDDLAFQFLNQQSLISHDKNSMTTNCNLISKKIYDDFCQLI